MSEKGFLSLKKQFFLSFFFVLAVFFSLSLASVIAPRLPVCASSLHMAVLSVPTPIQTPIVLLSIPRLLALPMLREQWEGAHNG